jgi:hypothetical protein
MELPGIWLQPHRGRYLPHGQHLHVAVDVLDLRRAAQPPLQLLVGTAGVRHHHGRLFRRAPSNVTLLDFVPRAGDVPGRHGFQTVVLGNQKRFIFRPVRLKLVRAGRPSGPP